MDITRHIHDAENSLREFIHQTFNNEYGEEWQDSLSLAKTFKSKWLENRLPDETQTNSIKGREKLIQYASIEDLRMLIKTYWCDQLKHVFEDEAVLDVYLKILDDYRNPDSRRRELFVHQKHLLLGISGEIRNRIATWRSKSEAGGIYSRIEIVRDNLGNNWTPGDPRRVRTESTLKVGDQLEFIVTAADPEDSEMKYRCHHAKWQSNNVIIIPIEGTMIEKQSLFHIMVKSGRKHHAYPMGFDDRVTFDYEVIPS